MIRSSLRRGIAVLFAAAMVCPMARSAERVTLKNGFALDCVRRETIDGRVRLYLAKDSTSYLEVSTDAVVRIEEIPDLVEVPVKASTAEDNRRSVATAGLTHEEMRTMLAHAGEEHNIDVDLLASVVRAESGGQVRAVSRAGAQGLMQLIPKTAGELGVHDTFQPEENISGGTAYLDQLLARYHDNVALALAAYNAGPAAVDRYHGIPPYRETRAYVARVIREFNRRKKMVGTSEQVAQAR